MRRASAPGPSPSRGGPDRGAAARARSAAGRPGPVRRRRRALVRADEPVLRDGRRDHHRPRPAQRRRRDLPRDRPLDRVRAADRRLRHHGVARGSFLPATTAAVWLWNPVSEPTAALLGLALLYFPDGHLPSPRWRAAATGWLIARWPASCSPAPCVPARSTSRSTRCRTRSGSGAPRRAARRRRRRLGAGGRDDGSGAASAFVRLRRADGDELQQLKLVLTVGAAVAAIAALA